MSHLTRFAVAAVAVLLAPLTARGQDAGVAAPASVPAPVIARDGMVVAQEARAARVGVDILRRAAMRSMRRWRSASRLAATYPRAGNLGGGGFMLIHLAKRNHSIAIDYRETAPAATTRDIFLDANGEADPAKSRDSGLAVGVPGTVAGLAHGACTLWLRQVHARAADRARDQIRHKVSQSRTTPRTRCRARSRGWQAGPLRQKFF